jgi:hypothetical protein
MANTLTNLIPDIYAAMDVVSRELVGLVPSVARDPSADRVAINQTLRVPITPANASAGNITPSMSLPSAADQSVGNKTLTITKQRFAPFSWSGEEQRSVNAGPGYLTLRQDQIAQAMRVLVNEMEVDLATAAYQGASRAYGTAGTTPFASDLSDPANIKKILDDNGTPNSDRTLAINTTAGAKLRTLAQLTKADEAADSSLLRQGALLPLHGFTVRESAQIQTVAKGTGTSYTTNTAGYAVGATAITLITGSGTILAGDVITFNGDTNKYVVASALSGGVVTLAAPGLRQAIPASATAVTVGNNFAANVGFSRNSILLATRLPEYPDDGDLALDRQIITDPLSGISFEFAIYPGYRMNVYHVSVCWGVSVLKPEHIAILLG